MYVIAKVNPREQDFVLHDSKAVDMTPWKHGKYYAIATLLVMLVAYFVFSPMVLAK